MASRISRTFTISLPPELAAAAERLAKLESRTISELFREALRVYYARRIEEASRDTAEYAATHNPYGYTEADVPRLIREVRAERRASQPARRKAKAS